MGQSSGEARTNGSGARGIQNSPFFTAKQRSFRSSKREGACVAV